MEKPGRHWDKEGRKKSTVIVLVSPIRSYFIPFIPREDELNDSVILFLVFS